MPKNKLEGAKLNSKEITEESKIAPDDILRAAEEWRKVAPSKFRDILDATTQ